jgi:Holliday junction resolvase RusA-like endonuclease
MIRFEVRGEPIPQPRPRAARVGRHVHIYTPDRDIAPWKRLVMLAARPVVPATPIEGPVTLEIDFFLSRPASVKPAKRPLPITKPDLDNLTKAVMDVITDVGIWRDDCQVCKHVISKEYAAPGCSAGVIVRIDQLEIP